MKKVLIFVVIIFLCFILFSRFFLGESMDANYDFLGVFDDVFDVFEWIADKIKDIYDGLYEVVSWWQKFFG